MQDIQTTSNYKDNHDWFRLSSDKKTIYVGADNGKPGDFMRVIVAATPIILPPLQVMQLYLLQKIHILNLKIVIVIITS